MMRLLVVLVVLSCVAACVLAIQAPREPLCGPDHPEWLDPRCRKLSGRQ